jgi:hypothetical protein
MALVACHFTVFSFKGITRLLGVVKCMPLPVLCRVAKITLLSEFSLVVVIFFVAVITDRWRVLEK